MSKRQISYTVCIMLAGHKQYINFSVSAAEHERIMGVVQEDSANTFIRIDSVTEAIAVRLEDLAAIHFLFDPGQTAKAPSKKKGQTEIKVYLRGNPEPLLFWVDQNEPLECDEAGGIECGQLGKAMDSLLAPQGETGETIVIEDEDGEPVVLRMSCMSMIRVPLWLMPG